MSTINQKTDYPTLKLHALPNHTQVTSEHARASNEINQSVGPRDMRQLNPQTVAQIDLREKLDALNIDNEVLQLFRQVLNFHGNAKMSVYESTLQYRFIMFIAQKYCDGSDSNHNKLPQLFRESVQKSLDLIDFSVKTTSDIHKESFSGALDELIESNPYSQLLLPIHVDNHRCGAQVKRVQFQGEQFFQIDMVNRNGEDQPFVRFLIPSSEKKSVLDILCSLKTSVKAVKQSLHQLSQYAFELVPERKKSEQKVGNCAIKEMMYLVDYALSTLPCFNNEVVAQPDQFIYNPKPMLIPPTLDSELHDQSVDFSGDNALMEPINLRQFTEQTLRTFAHA